MILEAPLIDVLVEQGCTTALWGPADFHRLTEDGALDLSFLALATMVRKRIYVVEALRWQCVGAAEAPSLLPRVGVAR